MRDFKWTDQTAALHQREDRMDIAAQYLPSNELADIVEASRLHFIEKKPQREISKRLRKSQSTISRLLIRAQDLGIVSYRIESPIDIALAEDIRKAYFDMALPMQRVSVVLDSQSDPKNKINVGCAAGDMFLSILKETKKSTIRITMSCGSTLWELIRHVRDCVRTDPALVKSLKKKHIELFPTTLYADHSIREEYPHTLVTALATGLRESLQNIATIEAHAPTLPTNFFSNDLTPNDRTDFIKKYKLSEVTKKASEADIILVGIGVTDDEQYQKLSQSFVRESRPQGNKPEIAYIPVDTDGEGDSIVSKTVVGLSVKQLRDISKDSKRTVLAFGGGKKKRGVINPLLKHPCFNNLVVDVGVAEAFLQSLRA